MIDVKHAVRQARAFLESLYEVEKPLQILLEEVEFDEGQNCWFVTLSFPRVRPPVTELEAVMRQFQNVERVFKTFKVDADTGEVRSMKIRAA